MEPVNSNFSMIEGAASCPLTSSPAALPPPYFFFFPPWPSGTEHARSPSQICCHGDLGQHSGWRPCLSRPSEWQALSKAAPPRSAVPARSARHTARHLCWHRQGSQQWIWCGETNSEFLKTPGFVQISLQICKLITGGHPLAGCTAAALRVIMK